MTRAAQLLSYILHPLLIPFFAVVIIMNLNTYISYSISPQVQRIIFSLVFVSTAALPVVTAMLLLQKGKIRSMEMESLQERRIPFITTAFYYMVCYYLLHQLPIPRLLSLMVLGAAISIFAAWLISLRWKVSIHMIGIGGLTGTLFAFSQVLNEPLTWLVLASLLVSGLLGSARLITGAHTHGQIYSGFAIGFITEWVVILWMSR